MASAGSAAHPKGATAKGATSKLVSGTKLPAGIEAAATVEAAAVLRSRADTEADRHGVPVWRRAQGRSGGKQFAATQARNGGLR